MIDLKGMIPEKLKEFLNNDQNRSYLVLGITAILAVLYLVFAILPKFTDLSAASRKVNELNYKINLVNNRVKRLDKMIEQLKELRTEVESYSKGLPDEKEIPEFLEELSSIAKVSDVKILSITPLELKVVGQEQKGNGYYREMPIHITAKSGYHQLGAFISKLEQGKRFITIENLRIQNDKESPRRHTIKIVLKTYVSVEEDLKGKSKKEKEKSLLRR